MAKSESLKHRVDRVVEGSAEELGRGERMLQFGVRLLRFCVLRLDDNNAMAMSAALSFRTIFALVPFLILAFLLLKSIGILEDSKQVMRQFLEESGLTQIDYTPRSETTAPGAETAAEITVAEKIEATIDHFEKRLTVGKLGPIGAVLLVWTALTLLMTMERSLNRIFEAPRPRTLMRRIMVYWSVVTLGPIVLAAAFYAGGKAAGAFDAVPAVAWLMEVVGFVVPLSIGVLFLGGVYALMPNTHVRWDAAITGATIVFPIWMVARWGFAMYIEHVGTKSLYGALALVPLFLLWLNLSWLIFLLGAQLAFALANRGRVLAGVRSPLPLLGQWDLLAAAVAVAHRNRTTGGPVHVRQVAANLGIPEEAAEPLLACLVSSGLVCRVADNRARSYVLARPADRIPVSEVLELGWPAKDKPAAEPGVAEVHKAVAEVRRRTSESLLNMTLANLTAT